MRFTKDHQWVALDGDVATVGVTAYAAEQLGDVVTVDLPTVGAVLKAGDHMARVQSVQAIRDLPAPLAGEVLETNNALSDTPELFEQDPENSAWIVRIKTAGPAQADALMDRTAYEAFLDTL